MPSRSNQRIAEPAPGAGSLGRRWPFYLAGVVVALLIMAYIGGGEEPVRPIVTEISPSRISGAGQ